MCYINETNYFGRFNSTMLALRGVLNSGLLKAFGGNSLPLTSNVQPAAVLSIVAKRNQSSVPQSGTAEANGIVVLVVCGI